ncbi:uncharacterized protein [Ptychodera flava]|uniref:uncharacterized protein n=1 Tax=Ptychodera flava TaxID=63121 RepID=UPI00396A700F
MKVSGFRVPDASYVIKSIYSVATLDFHQIKENWQRIMVKQVPVSLICGSADNYIEYARQKELFKYLNLPDECVCEIDARGQVINGSLELKQRLNAFVIKDGKHWYRRVIKRS